MQNSSPKQVFFLGFCLKFDPLSRFESKEFEQILTKQHSFSWNMVF